MTELEKLILQKKEIENRIQELKNSRKCYGSGKILKREFVDRAFEKTIKISLKTRISRDGKAPTIRYFVLTEMSISKDKDVYEYLEKVRDALNEYLGEHNEEEV